VDRAQRRAYSLPPIEAGANLDAIGNKLIQDCGLNADVRHGAYRDGQGNLQVYMARFITPTRINYSPAKQRATVETRDFAMPQILVEMHGRGGFEKGGFLDTAWSVIVDFVCIAILTWVLSGVYMWWHLRRLRGGITSFVRSLRSDLYAGAARLDEPRPILHDVFCGKFCLQGFAHPRRGRPDPLRRPASPARSIACTIDPAGSNPAGSRPEETRCPARESRRAYADRGNRLSAICV
jgi:hypothetical protein